MAASTKNTPQVLDPKLDLMLERTVDLSPATIWKAWTTPEHLKPWFCPKPWLVSEAAIDLRPGGLFSTVMEGPNGERVDNIGCYLEVVPNQRLVWTSALQPGYRPAKPTEISTDFPFTAALLLEASGKGTKYTAIVMHKSEADAKKHANMGFKEGWGVALDQLIAYMQAQGFT